MLGSSIIFSVLLSVGFWMNNKPMPELLSCKVFAFNLLHCAYYLKSGYLLTWNFADAKLVPNGSRVRLVNLPKKKNILRDLKSALQGIPGIINIVPAVLGNKKTRDPICKGFAFVDFKREDDAARCVITSILCLLPTPNPMKNNKGE